MKINKEYFFGKKYPAVLPSIILISGILLSRCIDLRANVLPEVLIYSLVILLIVISALLYPQSFKHRRVRYFFYLSVLFTGILNFQLSYYYKGENHFGTNSSIFEKENTIIYGTIIEEPQVRKDDMRLTIDCDSVRAGGVTFLSSGKILSVIYRNRFDENFNSDLAYGDYVSINCEIEKLKGKRNPGEFDYGEYLRMHGIDATSNSFGQERVSKIGKAEINIFWKYAVLPVRKQSSLIIDKFISGSEGEFLKGLVIGERTNISKKMKEDFIYSGTAHVIAVSGLNVVYVIIIIMLVLTPVPIPKIYKVIIILLLLFFYSNLTGNTPSIVRASVMGGIFLISQHLERKPLGVNIAAVAAIVILVIDPKQLFDAGFQLSFAAIISLILLYPLFESLIFKILPTEKLSNSLQGRFFKYVLLLFTGTFAVQIGMIPVLAMMFKKISVISFFSNLIAIPFSNLALALGFILVILGSIWISAAAILASSVKVLLYSLLMFIKFCAELDISYADTYQAGWFLFVCYYFALIILITASKGNLKARVLIVLMIAINFFFYQEIVFANPNLRISYLDTGKTDCTVLQFRQGTTILVNCGGLSGKMTVAERHVIPYLKTTGSEKIDLLILNTLNKEILINLTYLVSNFEVRKIILPAFYISVFRDKYIDSKFKKTKLEFADRSMIINRDGKFRIYLTSPENSVCKSMMTEIIFGSKSFLFSDSKSIIEDFIFRKMIVSDSVSVFKATSPGSFNFTSPDFIVSANPRLVVVSSQGKTKKHLHKEIFAHTLRLAGYNISGTAEGNALIFETDGTEFEKQMWQ